MRLRRGRDTFQRLRPLLNVAEAAVANIPRPIVLRLLEQARYRRSLIARGFRYVLVRSTAAGCGEVVDIREGVYLLSIESLSIGSRVSIHPMTYIDATGGVSIGDDVSIAHSVTIMSTEHKFDADDRPIREQGLTRLPTIIGDNTWIGAGARILAGVTIGSGSVIAAGAVVSRDVPKDTVVAGVPARPLKMRTQPRESTNR